MPRISDLKLIHRSPGLWPFAKRVYAEINEDDVFMHASAMAYAWIFAVFPFFIFLLSLLPYVPPQARAAAKEFIRQSLVDSLTRAPAETIMANVNDLFENPKSGLMSLGVVLTLYAASGGMNMTMNAIDQAFDVQKPRRYVTKRVIAMGLTVFMCVCILIILLVIPVGNFVTAMLDAYKSRLPVIVQDIISGPSRYLLIVARYIIGLTVMQILIGVVYHYGRSQRNRLRFFTPGSIFVALGWVATGLAMRVYVEGYANYSKTYGTVAGMVIMLMIFYFNAVILLVGAEIDSEIVVIKKEAGARSQESGARSQEASRRE
ncbi:MAG TPA: YihY/virulence factor BrkB family protein [Tepidisphaeraceae bacterium]|jgi:membrane protein